MEHFLCFISHFPCSYSCLSNQPSLDCHLLLSRAPRRLSWRNVHALLCLLYCTHPTHIPWRLKSLEASPHLPFLCNCHHPIIPSKDFFSSLLLELLTLSSFHILHPCYLLNPGGFPILFFGLRELRTAGRNWRKSQFDKDLVSCITLLSKF